MIKTYGFDENSDYIAITQKKVTAQCHVQTQSYQYTRPDGSTGAKVHMSWTQKGRLLIHEMLTKLGYVANYDKNLYR